jgi:2-oxoglutarate ferredoxin oxidoreductase subunit delta
MIEILINSERCKGCGLCVGVCPKKLLSIGEEMNESSYNYVIQKEGCIGCGNCYEICPEGTVIEIKSG